MKTLYLREMGMNDNNIAGDIKNHRVRVLENIGINYKGNFYSMFFEFSQWNRYSYRTENKRTGKTLKHPIKELINPNALFLDTQFEKEERDDISGRVWFSSWRKSDLERETHDENPSFTRADVLKVVNRYSIEKYNKVVLVEEEARNIINKIGSYREKEILNNNSFFIIGQWDDEHKIVTVTERANGNSCDVDLITKKITG